MDTDFDWPPTQEPWKTIVTEWREELSAIVSGEEFSRPPKHQSIGSKIRAARIAAGMMQAKLGILASIYPAEFISRFERGARLPNEVDRERLSAVLGIDL